METTLRTIEYLKNYKAKKSITIIEFKDNNEITEREVELVQPINN